MANPKHLEILKQGVEVWNEWKKVKPNKTQYRFSIGGSFRKRKFASRGFYLGFRYGDLSGSDLADHDFTDANLEMTNLTDANLSNAKFIRTNTPCCQGQCRNAKLMSSVNPSKTLW